MKALENIKEAKRRLTEFRMAMLVKEEDEPGLIILRDKYKSLRSQV